MSFLVAEPSGPTHIYTYLARANDSIKVTHDNEPITKGTLVQYKIEFGIEHLLFSFTHLGRIEERSNDIRIIRRQ